ncbi:MAG: hypothetical protein NTW16_15900 [Bacteroidetes bacterium]|nr:hypothetical protein [Bacteroidota bacterium]
MKTLTYLAQIIFLIFTLSSCNKDNDNIKKRTPGYFVLAELNNSESSSLKSTKNVSSSSFDFGDLKASKEFYFLLVNGGDEPIFNIALSTDNSHFAINPSQINQLSAGTLITNVENSGIIPILTFGITHGTNLNGVGYSELLPMGINTSVLNITGQTINNGDTIDINNSFNITVNAQVMDIELYEGSDKINLTTPKGSVSSNLGGLGFIRVYSIYDTSRISIKNIGNVTIDLFYGDPYIQNNHIAIFQSDSVSIKLADFINMLVLDSKGTITDNSRIQLGNDGKGYFSIVKDNHQ